MRRTPALIVGGGPAGAVAAHALAKAGVAHLLIERSAEAGDALCGGFLSWRTLARLERLGVNAGMLNHDPVTRLTLTWRGREARARLPRPGVCVSRRKLDALLLARAARAGAAIERGIAARGWENGVLRLADGAEIGADALLLATGKHELRGLARPAEARGEDPAMGIRVRLGPASGLDRLVSHRRVELHLFDRGYAGAARQEDGTVNLCLAVRRSRLTEAGDPAALLRALAAESPHLAERLAFMAADPGIDAIANVPYGWSTDVTEPGVFRLGDQAAVIPSLAGEGMGIAVASGHAAAAAVIEHGPSGAVAFQQALAARTRPPVRIASWIRAASERGWSAAALVAAVRLAPGLAGAAARLTRIRR